MIMKIVKSGFITHNYPHTFVVCQPSFHCSKSNWWASFPVVTVCLLLLSVFCVLSVTPKLYITTVKLAYTM